MALIQSRGSSSGTLTVAAAAAADDSAEARDWADLYEDYLDAELEEDEEIESYYFSSAAGRARVVLGNRRWGEGGFMRAGVHHVPRGRVAIWVASHAAALRKRVVVLRLLCCIPYGGLLGWVQWPVAVEAVGLLGTSGKARINQHPGGLDTVASKRTERTSKFKCTCI